MDDKSNTSLKADGESDRLLSRQHTRSKDGEDDFEIEEAGGGLKGHKAGQEVAQAGAEKFEGVPEPRADVGYLVGLALALGLSSMQFCLALGGTGQAVQCLKYQLNWGNDPDAIDFFSTVLSTSGIVGISIGSLYGGDFAQGGRRQTIIYFNALALVGTAFSLVLQFKVMCFGRFLFGLASGVLLCATPKVMEETIPPALIDKGFGASTNVLMCFFGFGQLLLSLGMPTKQQDLATSRYWMAIYGMQAPFCLLAIYLHAFVYAEEPIDFCVKMERREEAMKLIAKVYRWESPAIHQLIYEEKRRQLAGGSQQETGDPDNERAMEPAQEQQAEKQESVWHALTDPEQRGASWMAIVIAFFNNMSGIGVVNIYCITIFDALQRKGAISRLTAIEDSYYIGLSGFVGAVLSYYTVSLLSRRAVFIGGHLCMAVLLFATAYFVQIRQAELVLLTMSSFVVVFQATQGTIIWVYISEVVSSEAAMGLALFTLMMCLTIQSMTGPLIISSKLGIDGMFFCLGCIHVAAFLLFSMFLQETQGLTSAQKKKVYATKVAP